jgi:hypothetical protein
LKSCYKPKALLLAGLLVGICFVPAVHSQAAEGTEKATAPPPTAPSPSPAPAVVSAAQQAAMVGDTRSDRANMMYRALWGVEDLRARETSSGSMILFSYKVVDANKAKMLNDEKANPYMWDADTGTKLTVPETENAGKLRQVAKPQNGRTYWVLFLNNGHFVKAGKRVNIQIGNFHANGLIVDSPMSTPTGKKP